MKRVVINIFGKVQMVGFRYSVLQKAREFNIKGSARNLRDGSVEIEAQGEPSQIEKLIDWCKVGPPYVSVVKLLTEETIVKDTEENFEIY
ncbi:MAG: acylphosphatase [Tissierella sp.]|uniref:acylphosphatase n=1 Tax=Tissierella sp. TaxID=41274 RepID=UPI003F9E783F